MWRLNQPCVTTPVTQTLPHYDHTGESYSSTVPETTASHSVLATGRKKPKDLSDWLFSSVNQRYLHISLSIQTLLTVNTDSGLVSLL